MDKVILAKNIIIDSELGHTRPNDNQMVFGGTGSGKSMSIVIPTLCHMKDSSLIGTFAKRSIVDKAVSYLKTKGYKSLVWDLGIPSKGNPVPDPLSYVSSDDDVQELAKQIANGNPEYQRATKFDPWWRDATESLLVFLIYYVFMTEEHPSMKRVIELFNKLEIKEDGRGISTSLDAQYEWLKSKAPDSIAVAKFRSFAQLPYATAGCVLGDAEKAIQNMFPVSIQSAMSEDAYVDFKDFATNRTAIFIITSPVRTVQYAFSNLLFSLAIRSLMEFAETQKDNHLPRDVKLVFDDFSCGFAIQNYEKSISTFRAAGISSLMLCQSLSQLDATYGQENATVILDNCASLVYLPGGMNQQTASYIAKMLDLPLNDVMFMPMGNVVVFQSGHQPVIAPRYETLKDPLYQKLMAAGEENGELRSA